MAEQNTIRRGLNFYFYYWTIPIFFFLVLINYYSRNFKIETLDVSLMLSIVSFLFGFLITVSFSLFLTRFSSLKESLAEETGRLTSLYLLSRSLGQKFNQKIKERIDEYTIKTLQYYKKYELGRESIYGMYKDLDIIEMKNEVQSAKANSFLYILGELESVREKLEYLTGRRTEWSLKFSNYLLGAILIALLFLNRGDIFTNSLFIILSTTIVFILLLIEDYDSLHIGDYTINISNSEQLFDLIGKERYYPKTILKRVKLKKGKTYRIGIYDPKTNKDKIVSLSYKKNI